MEDADAQVLQNQGASLVASNRNKKSAAKSRQKNEGDRKRKRGGNKTEESGNKTAKYGIKTGEPKQKKLRVSVEKEGVADKGSTWRCSVCEQDNSNTLTTCPNGECVGKKGSGSDGGTQGGSATDAMVEDKEGEQFPRSLHEILFKVETNTDQQGELVDMFTREGVTLSLLQTVKNVGELRDMVRGLSGGYAKAILNEVSAAEQPQQDFRFLFPKARSPSHKPKKDNKFITLPFVNRIDEFSQMAEKFCLSLAYASGIQDENDYKHWFCLTTQMFGSGKTSFGRNFLGNVDKLDNLDEAEKKQLKAMTYVRVDLRKNKFVEDSHLITLEDHKAQLKTQLAVEIYKAGFEQELTASPKKISFDGVVMEMTGGKPLLIHFDEVDLWNPTPDKPKNFYSFWTDVILPLQRAGNLIYCSGRAPYLFNIGMQLYQEQGICSPDGGGAYHVNLSALAATHVETILNKLQQTNTITIPEEPGLKKIAKQIYNITSGVPRLVKYAITFLRDTDFKGNLNSRDFTQFLVDMNAVKELAPYSNLSEEGLKDLYFQFLPVAAFNIEIPENLILNHPLIPKQTISALSLLTQLSLYTTSGTTPRTVKIIYPRVILNHLSWTPQDDSRTRMFISYNNSDAQGMTLERIVKDCMCARLEWYGKQGIDLEYSQIFPFLKDTLFGKAMFHGSKLQSSENRTVLSSKYFPPVNTTRIKKVPNVKTLLKDLEKNPELKTTIPISQTTECAQLMDTDRFYSSRPDARSHSGDFYIYGENLAVIDHHTVSTLGGQAKEAIAKNHIFGAPDLECEMTKALHLRCCDGDFTFFVVSLNGITKALQEQASSVSEMCAYFKPGTTICWTPKGKTEKKIKPTGSKENKIPPSASGGTSEKKIKTTGSKENKIQASASGRKQVEVGESTKDGSDETDKKCYKLPEHTDAVILLKKGLEALLTEQNLNIFLDRDLQKYVTKLQKEKETKKPFDFFNGVTNSLEYGRVYKKSTVKPRSSTKRKRAN